MAVPFSVAAQRTWHSLVSQPGDPGTVRAVIGFDGFVDEILSVVARRLDAERFEPTATIADFADRIAKAAGFSTNFELVATQTKLGGNAPIMALAMARHGALVTCIGTLGDAELHPAFFELADAARVISLGQPGYTQALEFDDGKLMFGRITSLNDITWERLLDRIPEHDLHNMYGAADVIGFVNWTMLPHMSAIWRQFVAEVVPRFTKRPIAFFDLADPNKRSPDDLREALTVIESFQDGCRAYLGLNRKEAEHVGAALGIGDKTHVGVDLETATRSIAERLDIEGVIVHPTDRASAVVEGQYVEVEGPYTPKPRLTTGAGDNFNAGVCLGLALNLPIQDSLTLGVGTSGFYVREGTSPTFDQLRRFLKTHGG